MFNFTERISTRLRRVATPRNAPIAVASDREVAADRWERFDRFLIYGAERGTYYIRERQLVRDETPCVLACVAEDGVRAVERVVEIVTSGRAPRNKAARFVLALAESSTDVATRAAAVAAIRRVERSGLARHGDVVERLEAMQAIREMSPVDAARVIRIYGLTREMIPEALLAEPVVWDALLSGMSLDALIRNLGTMSAVGLLVSGSESVRTVVARLTNRTTICRSRVHPLALLAAHMTYARGRSMRGDGKWAPVTQVVDALDRAFYLAFENAQASGKRILFALDISGSMVSPVCGMPDVSCRDAAAALALVTAMTEPRHRMMAFTNGPHRSMWKTMGSGLSTLAIGPRDRLTDVARTIATLAYGGTNCAVPMLEALRHGWEVDAFVVITDRETWSGDVDPSDALREYRHRMGIAAKVVIVAMGSSGFTMADPEDAGMLDIAGFDPSTPQVITDFISTD